MLGPGQKTRAEEQQRLTFAILRMGGSGCPSFSGSHDSRFIDHVKLSRASPPELSKLVVDFIVRTEEIVHVIPDLLGLRQRECAGGNPSVHEGFYLIAILTDDHLMPRRNDQQVLLKHFEFVTFRADQAVASLQPICA